MILAALFHPGSGRRRAVDKVERLRELLAQRDVRIGELQRALETGAAEYEQLLWEVRALRSEACNHGPTLVAPCDVPGFGQDASATAATRPNTVVDEHLLTGLVPAPPTTEDTQPVSAADVRRLTGMDDTTTIPAVPPWPPVHLVGTQATTWTGNGLKPPLRDEHPTSEIALPLADSPMAVTAEVSATTGRLAQEHVRTAVAS